MADIIDPTSFKDLADLNPEDVCTRALCGYEDVNRCYTVTVWGDKYAVYPYEAKIERIGNGSDAPHEYLYVFIINYLLQAKKSDLFNEWISEKDIPGGSTFFRGPHEVPVSLISRRYSGNISEFKRICEKLNGISLNMADAAYAFKITPRIQVAVLFWDGDDEFPPESKILYDRSIVGQLALDIVFALSVGICTRIGKGMV
ncbi:MAG: DUF3786 domain-containing protein [Desulfamplus sp.]|nr:DUF3786 domain-containing protein [Desulfamplus sp.]